MINGSNLGDFLISFLRGVASSVCYLGRSQGATLIDHWLWNQLGDERFIDRIYYVFKGDSHQNVNRLCQLLLHVSHIINSASW